MDRLPDALRMRCAFSSRVAAVALAGWVLVSCVLVVDPPQDTGKHCAFRGKDTDCGDCLSLRCERAVDDCCGDDWCGGLISAIEGCAETADGRCDEVHLATVGATGARKALATCVTEFCRGGCERAPATSSSHCGETNFAAGRACSCRPASPQLAPNKFQCNKALFPGTRCCAPPTWPSAGTECACLLVTCSARRDGCNCYLSEAFDPAASQECRGDVCCQNESRCSCGTEPCGSAEVQVDMCGTATTPCGPNSITLDACFLP